MAQSVLGALKDAMIDATNPDTNFGSHANLYVTDYLGEGGERFSLLSFDISGIPSGATVLTAPLILQQAAGDWLGHTHWVYKLLHGDWVEAEVTFNNKSNGVTWTSGAISTNDWTPTDGVSVIVPDPWVEDMVEWDIAALVQDALASGQLNIIILGLSGTEGLTYYVSKDSGGGIKPELTVNYTLPAGRSQAHIIS